MTDAESTAGTIAMAITQPTVDSQQTVTPAGDNSMAMNVTIRVAKLGFFLLERWRGLLRSPAEPPDFEATTFIGFCTAINQMSPSIEHMQCEEWTLTWLSI